MKWLILEATTWGSSENLQMTSGRWGIVSSNLKVPNADLGKTKTTAVSGSENELVYIEPHRGFLKTLS